LKTFTNVLLVFVAEGEIFFEREAMMKKALWSVLAVIALTGHILQGQNVTIQENFFNEFITFYVSSVDVSTGAQDVELFEMEIFADQPSVPIEVEFKISIHSIPLGLDYDDEFLTVSTEPFDLKGRVRVRNTELDMNTTHLTYVEGGTVPISIPGSNISFIDIQDLEAMQSLIMQTGRLPDGTYRFSLVVREPNYGPELASWARVIISAHPVALELISPGGPLADVQNQTIMTTYPFFQWQSDPCAICSYRIRVARFIPDEHSSAEDAIEDQTVLPLEQALGWYPEKDTDGKFLRTTSFQYPQSGAVDLEPGNIYVWQVQKSIPTTVGDEFINSFIYAFMIEEQQAGYDPIREAVRTVLGDERYEQLFSVGGELMGFVGNEEGISISGSITIGGVELEAGNIDVTALLQIARLIEQGEISVTESEVQ